MLLERVRNMKQRKIKKMPFIVLIMIMLLLATALFLLKSYNSKKEEKVDNSINVMDNYSEFVKTKENVKLYDKNLKEIGSVSNIELKLDKKVYKKKYFYANNIEAYVLYSDFSKTDEKKTYETKRVPFNKEVTLNKNSKLYIDENSYYSFDKEISFNPIINDDKYYFVFDDNLVYVNKEDVKEEKDIDKYKGINDIAVINYHYVITDADTKECKQNICLRDYQYDEQMKYLKDNGYYTATMEDLDLWIDGKINLPEKSVVITIDDGWYLTENIKILEKYNLHATLFLIGSLASPDDYKSDSLEIHSHTWDMHKLGVCPIGRGGAILCKDKQFIVDDLKKSSESLNNSKYFAYPFYEYNDHAIEALKEAGFRMALAGSGRRVQRGEDKFKVPRFGISNTDSLEKIKGIVG